MRSIVVIDRLSKGDAKRIARWYNANTKWLHFRDKDWASGRWFVIRYPDYVYPTM